MKISEKDFLTQMIEHHKMAIQMSEEILKDKNISPFVKNLATNIIIAQTFEILSMRDYLKKL